MGGARLFIFWIWSCKKWRNGTTTHLSARLTWHDRGWDGRICNAPHLNGSCIVHQHIRDGRDDQKERRAAGKALGGLGWLPPCWLDAGAYAPQGYYVSHRDPLEGRNLPAYTEETLPYSCWPTPYRWLRESTFQSLCAAENLSVSGPEQPRDSGWINEPDRQRALLQRFWHKLEPAKSLIFYYCTQGNPLDENTMRLIVGVGRIAQVGPQRSFGTRPGYEDHYPVWPRQVTQDYPNQGVRIPYQEYLRDGHPTDQILCRVPQSALLPFSYVGEHVSDDVAVAVLERVIQAIERVRAVGYVAGDWERQLVWLNDVLAEVWAGRGAFPGLGSVLQYLGFEKGTAYQQAVLAPLGKQGINLWEHVLAILEGRTLPEDGPYHDGLYVARERWGQLPSRHALLSKLARFELSPDQVKRIADPDLRVKSGISGSDADLIANPYSIIESDLGAKDSPPVALETIDHGMRPGGDAARFSAGESVLQDDARRVRAVAYSVLQEAADRGDTLLTLADLLERVSRRFPAGRPCLPDREVILAQSDFHQEVLWMAFEADSSLVALKHLQALEEHISLVALHRVEKTNLQPDPPIDWRSALERLFGRPATDREQTALDEKQQALETLFRERLSVLLGGAGTGKTSVLKVFLHELDQAEGKNTTLLLAPTGKARVRLSKATGRQAMTIHQFLLRQEWLMPETFSLRTSSHRQAFQATTVVIDECSMLSTEVFGTLLRALDMNPLTRLILVGDPNQLPPIGPGRPFIDVIEWLKQEHAHCLASLNTCMRAVDTDGSQVGESAALALADGYRSDIVRPDDDALLAAIAKGQPQNDLEVIFWQDHDDLLAKLEERLAAYLGFRRGDYRGLNTSLGIDVGDWQQSERWQVLSPTRTQHFGTDELNRVIQFLYKRGLIIQAQQRGSRVARPFGEQEIVATDKVMQIKNRGMRAWPRHAGLAYVANGEIGIARTAQKAASGEDSLDVVFSTQPDASYRYFRPDVNENLELAYALTVHKAQGSDFDLVFFILPQTASTLSRELVYTGLTRFRKRLVLLIEKDMAPLLRLRSPDTSATNWRNTQTFRLALRPDGFSRPHLEALIHRTQRGVPVRSKSEVIVADVLDSLGISYEYEKPLYSRTDAQDFRLPDFTVSYAGDVYYWEHLGMLSSPVYREHWAQKLRWYQASGFSDRLITSQDGLDGSIDALQIERIARQRILDVSGP